ncbi:hypothetical protein HD553DRAFT_344862 [Filobasidium floriforme]|uniref:uncharacterized protein n=1 Tax=Filobasidium floriforme TaxID=5210 RepID=UPI001E8D3EAE|nr:uncharacterized protein HD553DRAFT_344855 [Filobasidium floriforme]XP_046034102.1 uncharacterized protein HD553DRAFT_344862 [Filobasidium floriforme]KAH8080569.1 hypothetical protein HD553DRAFT_344855 [Filobasidium floriforme]KAH8080576.1 hypothetical protein HD553DRAFT_344862 [Filobasidium floriforme]
MSGSGEQSERGSGWAHKDREGNSVEAYAPLKKNKGKQREQAVDLVADGIDPTLDDDDLSDLSSDDEDEVARQRPAAQTSRSPELETLEQIAARELAETKAAEDREALRAIQRENLKRKATFTDLRAATYKVNRTETDLGPMREPGRLVTNHQVKDAVKVLPSRLAARYHAVLEKRKALPPVGQNPTIKSLVPVIHTQTALLDEIVALTGEIASSYQWVRAMHMVQDHLRAQLTVEDEKLDERIKALEADAGGYPAHPAPAAAPAPAQPAQNTPVTGITMADLKTAIKNDEGLRKVLRGVLVGMPPSDVPQASVAGPSGTSNQAATSATSPTGKRSRPPRATHRDAGVHYAVKKLIGMQCHWGRHLRDNHDDEGYLVENDWPLPMEDGSLKADIELANGDVEVSAWRPDWKAVKVGSAKWAPFIEECLATVKDGWRPLKMGAIDDDDAIRAAICQYCATRVGKQPAIAENGGKPFAVWQRRRFGMLADRRLEHFANSPANKTVKSSIYTLLTGVLFVPSLHCADPPDTRRYPVLPQTGPDEPDIETDGWKVWRRYCFDGNKEAANKCDELCYPYWLSDEYIGVGAFLDAIHLEKYRSQNSSKPRWVGPRRYWPVKKPVTDDLRASLKDDTTKPDPDGKGWIIYRSMVNDEAAQDWEANDPLLWALVYPDPPIPVEHQGRPSIETLSQAQHRGVWELSRTLVACQKPDLTDEELLDLAKTYAAIDQTELIAAGAANIEEDLEDEEIED